MFHNFIAALLMKYSMCPYNKPNNSKLQTMLPNIVKTRREVLGHVGVVSCFGQKRRLKGISFWRKMRMADMCIHLRWSSRKSETWRNEFEKTLNISCEQWDLAIVLEIDDRSFPHMWCMNIDVENQHLDTWRKEYWRLQN